MFFSIKRETDTTGKSVPKYVLRIIWPNGDRATRTYLTDGGALYGAAVAIAKYRNPSNFIRTGKSGRNSKLRAVLTTDTLDQIDTLLATAANL